ncbi:MAG TPA: hypothetical protein VKQ72_06420 [Aggregatilineales bacterium]|nr:hypothetical protein [Aggregatilineales bacterium]
MCVVYTSRVGYRGPGGLDITVKSATVAGRILAPEWAMVGGVKGWGGYAKLSVEEYTRQFYDLLRSRFRQDSQAFLSLLNHEQLVTLCYCRPDVFCHRHLVVDILGKIAQARGLPFIRGGELAVR